MLYHEQDKKKFNNFPTLKIKITHGWGWNTDVEIAEEAFLCALPSINENWSIFKMFFDRIDGKIKIGKLVGKREKRNKENRQQK